MFVRNEMHMKSSTLHLSHGVTERGIALLTSLVFLVVLTLLGIGVFSTSTSDEKMARNFRDGEIALQGAEAAMNEAKMLISGSYNIDDQPGTLPKPFSSETCTSGTPPTGYACFDTVNVATLDLFSPPTGITPAEVNDFGKPLSASIREAKLSPKIQGLYGSSQPRYLIRPLTADKCDRSRTGKNASGSPYCFQIIAESRGRLGTTRVRLVELFTN